MSNAAAARRVIAVDWGTSSFRAYRLGAAGEISDRRSSARGILHVAPGEFPEALRAEIGAWLSEDPAALIMMSGMVGSRQGWLEVPYRACPCDLAGLVDGLKRVDWPEAEAWIVPGLTDRGVPGLPDVMRGEETQILGALEQFTTEEALVCLPGTHSKWVSVRAETIAGFATYMTGEVYDLLQRHSILARLMTAEAVEPDSCFAKGVAQGAREEALLRLLFSVRSRILCGEMPESGARAYLSGMLIGREVSAAVRAAGERQEEIVLLGEAGLTRLYEAAVTQLGCGVRLVEAEVVAAGLFRLARALEERSLQRGEA